MTFEEILSRAKTQTIKETEKTSKLFDSKDGPFTLVPLTKKQKDNDAKAFQRMRDAVYDILRKGHAYTLRELTAEVGKLVGHDVNETAVASTFRFFRSSRGGGYIMPCKRITRGVYSYSMALDEKGVPLRRDWDDRGPRDIPEFHLFD